MAITGTHMLFYTSEAEKLRAMLRDVFGFKHVDAGGGWLIFALPPSEIGVHPAEGPSWDSGIAPPNLVHVRRHPQDDRGASRQGRRRRRIAEGRGLRHHDDAPLAGWLRGDVVSAAACDRGRDQDDKDEDRRRPSAFATRLRRDRARENNYGAAGSASEDSWSTSVNASDSEFTQ